MYQELLLAAYDLLAAFFHKAMTGVGFPFQAGTVENSAMAA